MKFLKSLAKCLVPVALSLLPFAAHALVLPDYAQGGDLHSSIMTAGKSITDILVSLAGVMGIIGIVTGAIKIGSGDHDGGKRWVVGGVAGLIVAGSAYGIAALVVH